MLAPHYVTHLWELCALRPASAPLPLNTEKLSVSCFICRHVRSWSCMHTALDHQSTLFALKCHNPNILLFTVCLLFISCTSYLRQNGEWRTYGMLRKSSEGKQSVSISEFLVYKRSKMNHDLRYCG